MLDQVCPIDGCLAPIMQKPNVDEKWCLACNARIMEDKERLTQLLGEKMLQGYTLLGEYCGERECERMGVPMMKNRQRQIVCVWCEMRDEEDKAIKVKMDKERGEKEIMDLKKERIEEEIVDLKKVEEEISPLKKERVGKGEENVDLKNERVEEILPLKIERVAEEISPLKKESSSSLGQALFRKLEQYAELLDKTLPQEFGRVEDIYRAIENTNNLIQKLNLHQ